MPMTHTTDFDANTLELRACRLEVLFLGQEKVIETFFVHKSLRLGSILQGSLDRSIELIDELAKWSCNRSLWPERATSSF